MKVERISKKNGMEQYRVTRQVADHLRVLDAQEAAVRIAKAQTLQGVILSLGFALDDQGYRFNYNTATGILTRERVSEKPADLNA